MNKLAQHVRAMSNAKARIPSVTQLTDNMITPDKLAQHSHRPQDRCDACYTGNLNTHPDEFARFSPDITLCSDCVFKSVRDIWGSDRTGANYSQSLRMYKRARKLTPDHVRVANVIEYGPMIDG